MDKGAYGKKRRERNDISKTIFLVAFDETLYFKFQVKSTSK